MRKEFNAKLLITTTVALLFLLCSYAAAADKVVVIPLMGNEATGNATVSDVVKGKTFSNSADTGLTGTLVLPPTMLTHTSLYGLTFNLIPAGTFEMGSPPMETGRSPNENYHLVTLTESFYMQTKEVTQGNWRVVVLAAESAGYLVVDQLNEQPSECHSGDYNSYYPVEMVSWNDIQDWIMAFNQLTGETYALPTEAQWEYAARATTTTAWPYLYRYEYFQTMQSMGWYFWNNSFSGGYESGTKPVAQKQPNKWGLFDMQGNVTEWCRDWYEDDCPPGWLTDPTGPATGSEKVIRGGSWCESEIHCRAADRWGLTPNTKINELGFRLILLPDQQ